MHKQHLIVKIETPALNHCRHLCCESSGTHNLSILSKQETKSSSNLCSLRGASAAAREGRDASRGEGGGRGDDSADSNSAEHGV
eukprot:2041221-Rhodomonas_salina.1